MTKIAFVYVGNAGRSQLATAFAERERTRRTLEDTVEIVITMGCSVDDFAPPEWDGTAETWERAHPGGDDKDTVRAQRDEIRNRVVDVFDRLEATA